MSTITGFHTGTGGITTTGTTGMDMGMAMGTVTATMGMVTDTTTDRRTGLEFSALWHLAASAPTLVERL